MILFFFLFAATLERLPSVFISASNGMRFMTMANYYLSSYYASVLIYAYSTERDTFMTKSVIIVRGAEHFLCLKAQDSLVMKQLFIRNLIKQTPSRSQLANLHI